MYISDQLIRKLARSDKYQNLFCMNKDLNYVRLFKNEDNFSKLQTQFISWLYFYSNTMIDVLTNKIEKKDYEDDLLIDCYSLYKHEVLDKNDNSESNKNQEIRLIKSNKIKV